MSDILGILSYAGPQPVERRSLVQRFLSFLFATIVFTLVLVFVIARTLILLAGYICVFAGTILLTLGGHRSAAVKLADWRNRFGDLTRLWLEDLRRPIRRWRAARSARKQTPTPVQPIPALPQ